MKKLLLILMFCTGTALANPAEVPCDYAGSQLQMNACAIRDYLAVDAELNAAYKAKYGSLKTQNERAILLQAQRNWLKRRNARCMPKKSGPGRNAKIDYLTCMQDMTELRTLQLLR